MNDLNQLTEKVAEHQKHIAATFEQIHQVMVGQKLMTQRLFMGVVLGGHILIEGVPGLAKTTAVKALADSIHAKFQRIQFTPDLLPADILGTQIYNPKTQEFYIKKGPLFHNIILADEINRAPAKVQSALLEAMQEKQITIGEETFKLEEPFIVLATQNPVEQEGTYPLPEAQMDRFMFKVDITYPTRDEELLVMDRFAKKQKLECQAVLQPSDILKLRDLVEEIHVDPKINQYIVDLIFATRSAEKIDKDLARYIEVGASPRASINLHKAARCLALMEGRAYVVPQDIKSLAKDVLRHRIMKTYEAEAEDVSSDEMIQRILDLVPVP